jgi:hypothetical protein
MKTIQILTVVVALASVGPMLGSEPKSKPGGKTQPDSISKPNQETEQSITLLSEEEMKNQDGGRRSYIYCYKSRSYDRSSRSYKILSGCRRIYR